MKNPLDQALAKTHSQGQYEAAIQPFSDLATKQPQDAKIRIWLGAASREAGDLDKARTALREALRLASDSATTDLARTALAQLENESSGTMSHKDITSQGSHQHLGPLSLPQPFTSAMKIQPFSVALPGQSQKESSPPWWRQWRLSTKATLLAIAFDT